MASHVVNYLPKAVFANHIVLDASRSWFPLEMIQTVIMVVGRLPAREDHRVRIALIIARLDAPALLHDAREQLGVVAGPYDVLERLRLVLLVPILRNV